IGVTFTLIPLETEARTEVDARIGRLRSVDVHPQTADDARLVQASGILSSVVFVIDHTGPAIAGDGHVGGGNARGQDQRGGGDKSLFHGVSLLSLSYAPPGWPAWGMPVVSRFPPGIATKSLSFTRIPKRCDAHGPHPVATPRRPAAPIAPHPRARAF